ncbi:F-box/LRR-repeat protein 4 [Condylostylus longicornis]|uniref:F-box/LRR-repeat protein 4 n=1 Tax=Condylostylus longicornis TaxID=2530218 RepID=UPI00244DA038|nr:F-box/LRR-repeat protein 4 [Condylostylus longicornis]XP_055371282.1 F-box/LRR-repeat protein 4 [Condylostylus longicornis]
MNENILLVTSDDFTTDTTTGTSSSLTDVFDENVDVESRDIIIEQFAQDVIDFSSQYGSDYSISYTAFNITSRPSKFPDYGDFPETFAMRTYGLWWDIAPSKITEIRSQDLKRIPSQDFIVIQFEQYVIPHQLKVYETYNPGALIRIWALTEFGKWICLWEGKPDRVTTNKARTFCPSLKKISVPTRTIRLEFNHSFLEYFTEIDGVTLVGRKWKMQSSSHYNLTKSKGKQKKGPILRKLESIKFRPCFKENNQDFLRDFLINDLEKFIKESELMPDEYDKDNKTQLGLKDMPFEILIKIFSYLDLVSLFRVGKVCKMLYEVSRDPLLYSEINLKPYWHLASSELLCTLAKRSTLLKKLDISWCGLYGSISPIEFKKFIQQRGDSLTHLRLNCCKFLNASCMETVGIVCDNLRELSLRNYSTEPPILNFSCLGNLKNLERLDLFRTLIETDLLLTMLENNPRLKHLNLAFCGIGINMDEIAQQISKYNKELISIDMWKSHSLSSIGLQALSVCEQIEEVDFGWCLREEASPGESLKMLLKNCKKLKKLFLAAIRGITDRDIENIANLCPNLEQLDLMGVLGISTERCLEILIKCEKLKLLDLSFCDNIDENQINIWRERFNVSIKSSFVPSDFLA